MTESTEIVQGVRLSRRGILQIIFTAASLALGVNLIAGFMITRITTLLPLIVGLVLLMTSIVVLTIMLIGKRIRIVTVQAFVIYDLEQHKILKVPRYGFDLSHYLESAFKENPALGIIWKNGSLTPESTWENIKPGPRNEQKAEGMEKCAQIIREASEYFLMSKLSTHLTDYFNDPRFDMNDLTEYGRSDIPTLLAKNRFLDLFSRPMADREAFVKETLNTKNRNVVSISGPGGLYEMFDLMLPKNSNISKPGRNAVKIDMNLMKLEFRIKFDGFSTVSPRGFVEYYLGLSARKISALSLDMRIEVVLKPKAWFSIKGLRYFRWVDSFLREMEEEASEEEFYKRINWETAYTVIETLERRRKRRSEKK